MYTQAIELQCSGMLLILFSGDHTILQQTIAFIGKKIATFYNS